MISQIQDTGSYSSGFKELKIFRHLGKVLRSPAVWQGMAYMCGNPISPSFSSSPSPSLLSLLPMGSQAQGSNPGQGEPALCCALRTNLLYFCGPLFPADCAVHRVQLHNHELSNSSLGAEGRRAKLCPHCSLRLLGPGQIGGVRLPYGPARHSRLLCTAERGHSASL